MRVALDGSYGVHSQPSGIGVYSRLLLTELPQRFPSDTFFPCYRFKQWRSLFLREPGSCLLLPPLRTFRADVFHALNQRVDRRPARAVVTTFHDLFVMTGEYSTAEFRKRFTQQAKVAAVNSDLVIAVSAFTANQVADLLHFDRARIRVVPHGIRQPPDEPSQRAREPIVLFVGALQTRKNIVRLVDAFETLPPPWRLVLAGSPNGFGSEAILERIDRSPCRARIDVPGYVEMNELRNLYATASVFAFPSCDEGFGIPVLEAMAAGVPVITSNGSALAEVAGSAALLVDPFDVHSIATGLQALVSNEGLRTRLAAEGRERSKHFTESRTAYETYRVYQEAFAAS